MNDPPIRWQPIETLDKATRDNQLVTLKVAGRPVLASWHTEPVNGRSFWWNGDVTDEGELIETSNPTDWALVDLGSGLVDQSQKMTVAARAMADKKTVGHLS